ncbi:MAG: adenosylcobinamide-GDP ribazoletransferase [Breznakibacter sp.]
MKAVKHQWQLFATALMFFTRIPVRSVYSQQLLNRCNRYFPLVGFVVGGIGALVFWAASQVFSSQVAAVLSMAATILATGAFHEDGFADVCDGFGGGWDKDRILTIMKDSRVGAYGVIGMFLLLVAKYTVLSGMPVGIAVPSIITGHVLSRGMAVTTMFRLGYVRDDESSKAKPVTKHLRAKDLVIALTISACAFFMWPSWNYLVILVPMWLAKYFMERWFVKWIGGYTGDCLGSVQQVTELTAYLAIVALVAWGA